VYVSLRATGSTAFDTPDQAQPERLVDLLDTKTRFPLRLNIFDRTALRPRLETSMYHYRNINILPAYNIEWRGTVNILCRIIGHKFQNTIVIDQIGDFYDIQDAKYCKLCGEVDPET